MQIGGWKWWSTTSQRLSPSRLQVAAGLHWWTICQRQTLLLCHCTGTLNVCSLFSWLWAVLLNIQTVCRCNIAVILLTDLIVDHGVKVEWSAYLHLLLHAVFIGKRSLQYLPELISHLYSAQACFLIKYQLSFFQGLITITQRSTSTANACFFTCWLSRQQATACSLLLWCC